jgi:hypothetical protein
MDRICPTHLILYFNFIVIIIIIIIIIIMISGGGGGGVVFTSIINYLINLPYS